MPSLVRSRLYSSLLVLPLLALADTKIAGVKLADHYRFGNETLALNGTGAKETENRPAR